MRRLRTGCDLNENGFQHEQREAGDEEKQWFLNRQGVRHILHILQRAIFEFDPNSGPHEE